MFVFHVTIAFLLLVFCTAAQLGVDHQLAQLDQYLDPFDPNPRFIVKSGHLMVLTGRNKDLVFRSSGSGRIKINGDDIAALKQPSSSSSGNSDTSVQLPPSQSSVSQLVDSRLAGLEDRLNQLQSINASVQLLVRNSPLQRRNLRRLIRKVNRLERLLNANECLPNPCQNGAECEDGFNRYICRCREGFQGQNCEQDVNECAHYQGTELGCQNGGTCLNMFGGFRCLCPANFRGVRCTIEFNDCSNVSSHEICGNGFCTDLPRTQSGVARYRCVCYQGFTKSVPNSDSAPCDVDVDECATGVHRCSRHPPVVCINTRSGYNCGPCPVGYSGDGYTCSPVDLCMVNNGGCSVSPRVSCFSSAGRVVCGSCPAGFNGDGMSCTQVEGDVCSASNGGCSPLAQCRAIPSISPTYRDCLCPAGHTGNGIGALGCVRVDATTAQPSKALDSCASNPCQNHGACVAYAQGYSCICPNEYTGRNCEQSRSQCGGELDSEAGILSYPLVNGTSSSINNNNNITCIWLIKNSNTPGQVLNITFTKFNLPSSPRCASAFVELFDGPSREYKLLGKFCGDQLPKKSGIVVSSFNSVMLQYWSSVPVDSEQFNLNWVTIEPTCGGMITNLTHGIIESPGFPHHYPDHLDCHWQLMANFGQRLQFVFHHLDIENSGNYCFDYLEFIEGFNLQDNNSTENLIERICNWTSSPDYSVPPAITTSSNFAQIHFRSDAGITGRGFQLTFQQVPGVCGGLLTGTSGIFQPPSTLTRSSPTGSAQIVYQNNVVCEWLIRAMPEERILLRFLNFALESEPSRIESRISFSTFRFNSHRLPTLTRVDCMFDYVEVYDGEGPGAPLRARLCGAKTPSEIVSTGRFLRVKFRSDSNIALEGFTAQYTALCGRVFTDLSGTIQTPNYPSPIGVSRNCTYTIHAPLGHIIRLEITSMDIEPDRKCMFDYIEVEGKRTCGKIAPPPVYSMNNELQVVFVNDESNPSKGFRARYESIALGCGGVLKQGDPISTIRVRDIGQSALVSQCFWEIRANESFVVMVRFINSPTFNRTLVINKPCNFTTTPYIIVSNSDGSLIKKFCVEQLLTSAIWSTGTKLFISYVFQQSEYVTTYRSTTSESPQFSFEYQFMEEAHQCGRNMFANSGVIRSPHFPLNYPAYSLCTWLIHVDNGLQIKLNFTRFKLEPEITGMCFDRLEIRNGRRFDSPLIGQFCGTGPLPDIVSHSNYLYLRFSSDRSLSAPGFEVYYTTIDSACGGLMSADSGAIESPDYPRTIFSNMNCEWKIRVSEGSTIELSLGVVNIEPNSTSQCQADYLEIFDGDNDGARSIGRFCDVRNRTISSSTNKLFIRLVTDATVSHGGFSLSYRTICSTIQTGRYGVIESPNYPFPHSANLNCTWRILTSIGNNLTVSVSALILEPQRNCNFDRVSINEVNRSTPLRSLDGLNNWNIFNQSAQNLTTKKVLCGNYSGNLPQPIKLSTNEAVINFMSDETRSASGFRLEWAAVGCGGEFNGKRYGIISSPGFPNPYPREVECLWHIKAPDGNRVDLLIDTLDLEYSKECTFDYLQVFAGPSEESAQIAKLCNQAATKSHISSIGNQMTVKLVSEHSMKHKGFFAKFRTYSGGCGGRFSAASGTLISPNYGQGNRYDVNSDCTYRIEAAGNFVLELTVNDFQIAVGDSGNCSNTRVNYFAIYDAPSEVNGKLMAKYCGEMGPMSQSVFRSTDSSVFVRFKSDGLNAGRGFNITYRRVCGKTVTVAQQDGYKLISSSHYPHIVDQDEECRFVLKAANPSDSITVQFTYLQSTKLTQWNGTLFQYSAACSNESVELYEGTQALVHKRLDSWCLNRVQYPPKWTKSTGDTMLLITRSAVFQAMVSSIESFCGGDFNLVRGYIANPGYTHTTYPLNIECIWTLRASPGNRFVLRMVSFDLEESDYCNGDYLEIRAYNSSGPLIGDRRLCGNSKENLPSLDNTYTGDVWIKFKSDDANVATGFLLGYETATNVLLSGDSGQLSSPGYPNSFFWYNQTFVWSIVVSPGSYVKLDFVELSLNSDNPTGSNQLSVYNSLIDVTQMDPTASFQLSSLPEPKITYTTTGIPRPFVSDNNVVTVLYFGAYFSRFPIKFRLKWSALNQSQWNALDEESEGIPSDVNSTFSVFVDKGEQFNLVNDNFSQYGNDINWYFSTRSSMHFNLSVSVLSFHPSISCWFNKFTVYDWSESASKWRISRMLCNGNSKTHELTGANVVRIRLQYSKAMDEGLIKPRYNMTIYPVCGGNFTEPSGTISTEDIRDGRGSAECRWAIKVRPGRTILMTVQYYSIGVQSVRCSRSYLQLRNGYSDESPLLIQPLCGQNSTSFRVPETSGNNAVVMFKFTSTDDNFRLNYREVGLECGGEFVLKSVSDVVSFSSPDYPDSPSHEITCEWIIRGPLDVGLQLTFTPEPWKAPCYLNDSYVDVYRGGSALSSQVTTRLCMPPFNLNTIYIDSHITMIRYVMLKRNFNSKFNATIKPDFCNREYFLLGSMRNLQLPIVRNGKVVLNLDSSTCSMHFRTASGYNYKLTIESLNLEGDNCSSGEMIEFRDSPQSENAFTRFCPPRTTPNASTITSLDNELYITYRRVNFQKTSNTSVGMKFNVIIISTGYAKCRKTIDAKLNPTGVIRLPEVSTSNGFSCDWRLNSQLGTRFVLHFDKFYLGFTPSNFNSSNYDCPTKLYVLQGLISPPAKDKLIPYGCSKQPTEDITSLFNTMRLYFIARDDSARVDLQISYRTIYDNDSCSATLDSPHGQIISSNFANLNQTGQIACLWELSIGVNQSATLLLDTFDVPGDCSDQPLQITVPRSNPFMSHSFATRIGTNTRTLYWNVACITRTNAPQVSGTKYILPIYRTQQPKIVFDFNRTEAGQWKGLRGEYFIQNCGGYFEDFQGEIASPNYPNTYSTDTFCNWHFGLMHSMQQYAFQLVFTEFEIDDNCDLEYFSVKPRVGMFASVKLCKRDGLPKSIPFTHNLLISFVSSRNLSLSGPSSSSASSTRKFKFQVERTSHGCGGLFTSISGYFQSPNYVVESGTSTAASSHQYSSNTECVWQFQSLTDYHFSFKFNSRFDVEQSDNCTNDYLLFEEKVIDFVEAQEVERWVPLKRLCGHKTPETIVSQGNLVRVTFRTNDKVVGDGFRVTYRQECGGIFQGESGTVTSPLYSQDITANGLNCVYQIERAPHEYIRVDFEEFDLEENGCNFDYVTVYLGNHTNSSTPQYGPYCGKVLPPALSSQGKIVLVFKTDGSRSSRGFKFRFSVTTCGGNITDSAGIIVSPEMDASEVYKMCTWKITVPESNNAVAVRITKLDLPQCQSMCCNYIKIYDTLDETYMGELEVLGYLCTNNHQELTFKSSSNKIMIKFFRGGQQDAETNGKQPVRFKLQYWSTPGPKTGCGGTLRDMQGVITSPDIDGDSYYEPNLNCIWTINVPFLSSMYSLYTNDHTQNQFVELEFERFDVEEGSQPNDCDNDYLAVYDGTDKNAALLANLCGRIAIPEKIQGNTLQLHFITNDNVTGHGFRARFEVHNRTCGGYLNPTEQKQLLTSPNYPNGYDVPQQCTWSVSRHYFFYGGYNIPVVLTIEDLDLNCTRGDYLQLLETVSDYEQVQQFKPITLCSSPSKLKIITSSSFSLTMKVSSTAHLGGIVLDNQNFANSQKVPTKDSYRGFSLTYHSSLCNETLDSLDNGYVLNRNYPKAESVYPSLQCYINISVPEDRYIALYFTSFSFYHCHYSNLTIAEGNSSLVKATFCNSANTPSPFFSTSSNLIVKIDATFMSTIGTRLSDYSNPNFLANRLVYAFNYLSSLRSSGPPGCGGNLTAPSGAFSSPNYPQPQVADRACTWLIHSNGYHSISLKFDFFRLSFPCTDNYLMIYDGEDDVQEKLMTSFCGNDKPATIKSQSNALLVKLVTTANNYEPGFLASYKVNTQEPKIRGRVITSNTFRYNSFYHTYSDL